jgi:sugar lactone lactonase YvrE
MGSDTLPGTPGNQIAVAVAEVRSASSPWKVPNNDGWELRAPDVGNGVMWLMSTAYVANQPANLASSFYYNFINTGPAVTGATMSCGVDNYGYIVLNGVKYPSTNGNMSLGYEGIAGTVNGSFTVTVPTGLNTLELRGVNAGPTGNSTWQNQGFTDGGPTAAWLAITTGTTVLVKTTNKWKCTQFDYPAKFIGPVSLGDVGENAGLSRPYSLAALSGKVMYDNSRFSTTLASPVALHTTTSKTFVYPGTSTQFNPENQGIVITLAGDGFGTLSPGSGRYIDGTGTGASFNTPSGVAVDSTGNVIVADSYNHRIRKVSFPNGLILNGGVVTTLAGSGSQAFADGTGAGASFHLPVGVVIDASDNVIVADNLNHRIRKVTPGGVVTTLAGSGQGEYADGTGAGASFKWPRGVAIDASNNIIVADYGNQRIRKVTNPGGVVTTLAGGESWGFADGTGSGALFSFPTGVAVDASNNVIVSDGNNYRIRKVTNPGGVVTTLAGGGTRGSANGTGADATFDFPYDVSIDASNNIIVPDRSLIRKVTNPGGVVTTIAGNGSQTFADGAGTGASFYYPEGVEVDASGNIFVADTGNNRIRVIT